MPFLGTLGAPALALSAARFIDLTLPSSHPHFGVSFQPTHTKLYERNHIYITQTSIGRKRIQELRWYS